MTEPARRAILAGLPVLYSAELPSALRPAFRPTVHPDPRGCFHCGQTDRLFARASGRKVHRSPAVKGERYPAIRNRAIGDGISTTQPASRRGCAIAAATVEW